MANVNLVDKDKHDPGTAICPHCKRKMIFDISMFRDNITKIVESPCPYCKKTLFTCVLILTNTSMYALTEQLKSVVEAAEGNRKVWTP